jgi:hypothetical protein
MLVYISAPYTLGDQLVNVRNACLAGDGILKKGHYPLVPHLTALYHAISPKSYDEWLDLDRHIIPHCDALLRLPGKSKGADIEEALAKKLGIPIYHDIEEIPDDIEP